MPGLRQAILIIVIAILKADGGIAQAVKGPLDPDLGPPGMGFITELNRGSGASGGGYIGRFMLVGKSVASCARRLPLYQDLRSVLESIGVKNFKISFSGGTLSSVINILSESDALTVLPYSVVFNMRRRNLLGALSIRIGDPDRHLCLLARKVSYKNRMLDRLESFVTGELRTLQTLMRRREQETVWRR